MPRILNLAAAIWLTGVLTPAGGSGDTRPARASTLPAMEASPGREAGSLSARDSAHHLLQRLAYGPLPGQIERVAEQGVMAWFEAQLRLDGRSDPALAAREAGYEALTLDPEDWARRYVDLRQARRERRAETTREAADSTMAGEASRERADPTPEQLEARRLLDQVRGVAVLRAVMAEAQVREVMAAFWFNHFNVYLHKGADRYLLPTYVEQVIRPRALGRFSDLLLATARSPAMLFYLDNVQSVAPGTMRRSRTPDGTPRPRGINENYARELLELHTLGVDGGYTQQDVVEVARILTGWAMKPPEQGGGFVFRGRMHDYGEKTVFGVRFPAGRGEEEGVRLLAMLARHPATIRHLSHRLCARLVRDDPPDGCVDAAVAAWQRSDGDLREVLRAIVRSPDFWSAPVVRSKVKTPLEFVVSAARAVSADPDDSARLADAVARLGEPLYLQPSPAGYPERQEEWVNSGALLGRMNFAVALAAGRQPGAAVNLDAVVPAVGDHQALVEAVDERVLGGAMTPGTRGVILRYIAELRDPDRARALAVGLALGSPEFQRQ